MGSPRRGIATDQLVAQNVTRALKEHGVSRSHFAKALGVSPASVTFKLAGEVTWSAYDLQVASTVLNVPINQLFMHS